MTYPLPSFLKPEDPESTVLFLVSLPNVSTVSVPILLTPFLEASGVPSPLTLSTVVVVRVPFCFPPLPEERVMSLVSDSPIATLSSSSGLSIGAVPIIYVPLSFICVGAASTASLNFGLSSSFPDADAFLSPALKLLGEPAPDSLTVL